MEVVAERGNLKSSNRKEKNPNTIWCQMLTRLIVMII